MPYYRISYKLPSGRLVSGIKQFHLRNIDDTFLHFQEKAIKLQPDLVDFDCVMVSEKSQQFRDWIAARNQRKSDQFGTGGKAQGPGKYRQKGEGPELGKR